MNLYMQLNLVIKCKEILGIKKGLFLSVNYTFIVNILNYLNLFYYIIGKYVRVMIMLYMEIQLFW